MAFASSAPSSSPESPTRTWGTNNPIPPPSPPPVSTSERRSVFLSTRVSAPSLVDRESLHSRIAALRSTGPSKSDCEGLPLLGGSLLRPEIADRPAPSRVAIVRRDSSALGDLCPRVFDQQLDRSPEFDPEVAWIPNGADTTRESIWRDPGVQDGSF